MGSSNYLKFFLMGFLLIIISIILMPTQLVKADLDAGTYTDLQWNSSPSTVSNLKTRLPIGPDVKLGYAFGLASDKNGNVTDGQDQYLSQKSESPKGNNIYFSKMNVFLDDKNQYINSTFQGGISNNTNAEYASRSVSFTSPDFLLTPPNTKSILPSDYSILGSNGTNTGLGETKKYYQGHDNHGNDAFKIDGTFSRGNNGATGDNDFNLQAELLLRASPSNSAIAQRELFLKNNTNRTQTFQILFGEDTKLYKNDRVLVKDLGNKTGLFIENGTYKLMVTNELPDGFEYYSGQPFDSQKMNWASGFDANGNGAESKNYSYGDSISGSYILSDSSYSLKWKPTTLQPGQTVHFASTIGVTVNPYALPVPKKTYKNLTTGQTESNRVGDKLQFSLNIRNNGYQSSWSYNKIEDRIPDGLQIDPNSVTMTYNNGSGNVTQKIPDSYDATTKTLSFVPSITLGDGKQATVNYDATITDAGGGKTLINTAYFTGHDTKTTDKAFNDSVKIPVIQPQFSASFTKQLRNESNHETNYVDSTSAKKDDLIDYLITYQVNSNSLDSLAKGSHISDTLPTGLEFVPNSVLITASDNAQYGGSLTNIGLGAIAPGRKLTVAFKAKVTSSAIGVVSNIANFAGGKSSTGQILDSSNSNPADVKVQSADAIQSVPSLIDFGSTNMYKQTKILDNISTVGSLIINHPTNKDFNVSVSYDNDDINQQLKNKINGDTLSDDGSGIIFLRQRNTNHTDSGSWIPISPTGTSIRKTDFAGNQQQINLSNYVGVGAWRIKLAPNTSAGSYKGILTWTMSSSI